MPEVDSKLVTGLRQAKQAPMFFAFVAKGASDGALIVSKKKIPVKEINEAKAECGGKMVFKGRCQGEDGKMVFELSKEPPGILAKQIKTVIQRDAGMVLQVETRVAADLEDEEGGEDQAETPPDGAPPKAPPPPPGADATRFSTRLKAMAPVMEKALATGNKPALDARQKIGAATTAFRQKDYAQANALLDQAEPLLKQALAAPPQAPPASADGAARFSERLKALAPEIQKALAAGNPAAQDAKLKIGEANVSFRKKDFEQANALLDQAEKLLKQAPAAKAPPPPPTAKPAPTDTAAQQAEWERRIIEIEPRVLQAKKTRPNDAKWMTLFMSVQDLGEAGNYGKALDVLNKIEELLAAPSGAAPSADQNGSFVAMQTSRLKWDQTRKKVESDLKTLEKAILDQCKKINDDPDEPYELDMAAVAAKVKTLYGILEKLDTRLLDKLDEALNAKEPAQRTVRHNEAKALVKDYVAFVGSDPLIAEIDNNGFAATQIRTTVSATLSELSSKL